MQKKAYLISFLVIALVLGAWTASPAPGAKAQLVPEARSSECKLGADLLVGPIAEIPRVKNRVRQICDFNIRLDAVGSDLSEMDRRFIEDAIVSNMAEIQALEFAIPRVANEEWRGLLQMMLAMHQHDLEGALKVAERFGLDTTPDLTNVRVYPGTPDYDLGMRRVDVMAKFLTPLMNAGGGVATATPTAIPTYMTGTPTTTAIPTGTVTAVATDLSGTPTITAVPTDFVTDTPTVVLTASITSSPTFVPTPTGTATPVPPTEVSPTMASPTGSPTPPPPGGGPAANFDMLALHIFEDMHHMFINTAMAAQHRVENDEIRAFAKHSADGAELHMLLMSDLKHRLFDVYTPPPPDFQRDYQSPRRFEPVTE